MTVNSYFNNTNHAGEQKLREDLIIEDIQINGHDLWYIKRNKINDDYLFGESSISEFTEKYVIEFTIPEAQEFGGTADFLTSFGLEMRDSFSLEVSKKRFIEETGMDEPHEGDLIYIPFAEQLIEVRHVMNESEYYQMGKNFVFRVKCDLFEYSGEKIQTDDNTFPIDDIDDELANIIDDGTTRDIDFEDHQDDQQFDDSELDADRQDVDEGWEIETIYGDV